LNDRITLEGLQDEDDALELAHFYLNTARREAELKKDAVSRKVGTILSDDEIRKQFRTLYETATKAGDTGLRQRSFLHALHVKAEKRLQADNG
jgi:hypothetical protein